MSVLELNARRRLCENTGQFQLDIIEIGGSPVVEIFLHATDGSASPPTPHSIQVRTDEWPWFVDAVLRISERLELQGLVEAEAS